MTRAFALHEVAAAVGGAVDGDGAVVVTGIAGLDEAGEHDLSFLANRRYARRVATTRAAAVILAPGDNAHGRLAIRCAEPYLAFSKALRLFHPSTRPPPGIDPSAVSRGDIHPGATLAAHAFVGAGASVGDASVVMPFAYVGAGARVGSGCTLMPGSVVMDGCTLGDRVVLNPGAVVGAEGFGFVPTADGLVKIPQTGTVVVDDDVEIGANSCVDRPAMGVTRVRRNAKLDNLVQVGHAADIGESTTMVAYSGVAGSTVVGRGVVLAARATVLGHLRLGDGARVGACSMVTRDLAAAAAQSGSPAIDHRQWLRVAAVTKDLPELQQRVEALERALAALAPPADRGR